LLRPIQVSLRQRAGPLDLDVQCTLDVPWTALLAPSGAGKTTILRMIAGLDRPDAGRISVTGGPVLLDTASRIFVPPHRRNMRMVAQRPALFPHLSVLQNIRYRETPESLNTVVDLCRVGHLRHKMPSALSGGERQRVALARTLAAGCGSLLMLDEPFTGLEAALRDDLIRDLRAWTQQQATPVLLVTHDLGEVFAAEAHVLKMEGGRIVASGPAAEVLAKERERLIARLGR
jgi:molybdate transport system ATP-binding protein